MSKIVLHDLYGGKIFCDFFGVVLPSDPDLFEGIVSKIFYKTIEIGEAKINATRSFKMHELRGFISSLETGENDVKFFSKKLIKNYGEIKPNDMLVHVSVKYLNKNFITMDPLIKDWWEQQKSEPII